jgi:MoCo/4Fe-4S cofactor protein with predicted Tat translocation signal
MSDKNIRKYWSTLEQYEEKEIVEKLKKEEFFSKPESILKEGGELNKESVAADDLSRKDFLKLSGMASVLALVGCSERPVEKILPYINAPDEIIPGVANYYSSSSDEGSAAIVVKTREGRPIRLDLNKLDKSSGEGLSVRAQAAIYDLYDPARARMPVKLDRLGSAKPEETSWQAAEYDISEKIKQTNGDVALLTGTINGPMRNRVVSDFLKSFKSSRHVMIDAFTDDSVLEANYASFGKAVLPHYHFDKAQSMVFLGADPLADSRELTVNEAGITKNRKIVDNNIAMSRIHSFEATMTQIGMIADYRYSVKNEDMAKIAFALLNLLLAKSSYANDRVISLAVSQYPADKIEKDLSLEKGTISKVAQSLWDNRGKSIVYSEGNANRSINSKALHTAVNLLNSVLGNVGKTIDFEHSVGNQSLGNHAEFEKLVADMESGKISTLILYKTNPIYFSELSDRFQKALMKVKNLVSLNDRVDETTRYFDYLLPSTHTLESWGDREFLSGKYTIVQPTIHPIWDNRSFEESLMSIASSYGSTVFKKADGSVMSSYDYLRMVWKDIHKSSDIAADFETFWVTFVRDGVFDANQNRSNGHKELSFNASAFSGISVKDSKKTMTLSVFASPIMGDGSQNNNPYLFEIPDPVSKITWDNFLALSPKKAKELGLKIDDLVKVTVNGKSFNIPLNVQPGQHHDVATIAAGWGRNSVGLIGNGDDGKGQGINTFSMLKDGIYSGAELSIEKTGMTYKLANVQGHQHIDETFRYLELHDHHKENYRPIVFEASLNEYKEDPKAVIKYHTKELTDQIRNKELANMWNLSKENVHKYPGHRWGMTVDLNSCTGCNACSIACSVENNVPAVGKNEVLRGREMHWIRIDRYYVGEDENPQVINQPMMCQHCDNAPCETVCPVVATTHNGEGINVMTYNRCVGTRYCANNCPYKVRRFNFHEYTAGDATKGFPQTEDIFGIALGTTEGLNVKDYDLSQYPMNMVLNPDVTVREKGVMEKCNFCSQRIRDAKYEAKLKGVSANEVGFTVACAQACPTNAIVFGDMNDPKSEINELRKTQRVFGSLSELNTEPSVAYLARIRNQDEPVLHHGDEAAKSEKH